VETADVVVLGFVLCAEGRGQRLLPELRAKVVWFFSARQPERIQSLHIRLGELGRLRSVVVDRPQKGKMPLLDALVVEIESALAVLPLAVRDDALVRGVVLFVLLDLVPMISTAGTG